MSRIKHTLQKDSGANGEVDLRVRTKETLQYNLVNETNLVHNILSIFRQFYLETLHVSNLSTSIIRRKTCVYRRVGILLFCTAICLVCRINPVHQTASCTEYCAQSWYNLKDYIEMHGQKNINLRSLISSKETARQDHNRSISIKSF